MATLLLMSLCRFCRAAQDEEELEWLTNAKKGNGIEKSERRRESAETEYHRLLCEESMQQARHLVCPSPPFKKCFGLCSALRGYLFDSVVLMTPTVSLQCLG